MLCISPARRGHYKITCYVSHLHGESAPVVDDGEAVLGEGAGGAEEVQGDAPPVLREVDAVAVRVGLLPRLRAVIQRQHHPEARTEAEHEGLDGHGDEARDARLQLPGDDLEEADDEGGT